MPPRPRARPDLSVELIRSVAAAGRPYTVWIRGFSEFERRSLSTFFKLVSDRTPAYRLGSSADESDFLIGDGIEPGSADEIARTVFLGAEAPMGALGRLPRPADPVAIVSVLDAHVFERESLEPSALPPTSTAPDDRFVARHAAANLPGAGHGDLQRDDDPFFFLEMTDPPIEPAMLQLALPWEEPPVNWRAEPAKRVLVVDDSHTTRRLLEARLGRFGYEVSSTHRGAEALDRLSREVFHIVLLDLKLGPGDDYDGRQLCRYLKRRDHHPCGVVPVVILLCAGQDPHERLFGEFAGGDACLTKPIEERALVNVLGRCDNAFCRAG